MVKELLLGDNPFIGVSHLAQEKAREEQNEVSLENKVRVIEAAFKGGATGFTFSTHSSNLELLKYLKKNRQELADKLNYYILVPYAAKYIREATFTGTMQLVKKVLANSFSFRSLQHVLWPKPISFIKMFLETELKEYLTVLPRLRIRAILLHEVLTELIVAFNLDQVVKDLIRYFLRKGLGFGLETRNVKYTKLFLENNGIMIDYLMTPLNPLGYQMTPTKEEAEKCIIELSMKGVKVIAVNILASGAVTLEESFNYMNQYRQYIFAVAVGTSKAQRAIENFTLLSKLSDQVNLKIKN